MRHRNDRAKPSRKRHMLACSAGAGAAFTYLFDPDQGRHRRARMRDRMFRVRHDLADTADVVTRDGVNRSQGLVARADHLMNHDGAPGDGRIYHEVTSRIATTSRHPRAIRVRVVDGYVTLTGPVLAEEVDRVRAAVKRVAGVEAVDDQLDVHDTAGHVPALQGEGRTRGGPRPELLQQHWAPAPRALAGAAGGTLLVSGLARGGIRGLAVAAGGGLLLARAVTNQPVRNLTGIGAGPDAVDVEKHIRIDAPTEKVWAHLKDFERFPTFMSHVQEVTREDDNRSHWRVDGPLGTSVEWDAELVEVRPNEALAWRSRKGSPVQHTGRVVLEPAGDASHMHVHLSYNPAAGVTGHAVARMFGADPKRQLDDDLLRMKTLIETGKPPRDATQR